MKIIEISEDGKKILCEKIHRAKESLEDLEHELQESTVDTRMGYRRDYDHDRDRYDYDYRNRERERYRY